MRFFFLLLLFLFKFKLRLLMCWVRSATASGIKAWRRPKSSPCPGTYHSQSPAFFTFKSSPRYTFGSFGKFEKSSRGLYICPSCKQEYKKAGIRRHILFMHINSNKPGYPKSKCEQCGKEVVIEDPLNQKYIPLIFLFLILLSGV